ncbi:hypothetical protein ACVWW3_005416 [Bradyrhizobium sp. LM2.9]
MNAESVSIRPARREDVAAIVAMLADDRLGSARERVEDPLPGAYYEAFARVGRDENLQLVVAESEGRVVGCLQLAILPGISSQGGMRGLLEDVRVASDCRSRGHRRAIGAMGGDRSESARLQSGRIADSSDANRCAALLQAARIYIEPRRHDCSLLMQRAASVARSAKSDRVFGHVKS